MVGSSKRPGEDPSEADLAGPAPLGALSLLPEVLLAHLCSFLSGRDLARLGGACAALHESPVSLWPRLKVGLRRACLGTEGENEEERQRRVEALRMLARRAASGLRELRLWPGEVMEAFCAVVREGGGPLRVLTSLHVEFPETEAWDGVGEAGVEARAVAELLAAGQLPMLRELHLFIDWTESMPPIWRAVGEGACPRLEKIEINGCRPQQLWELAEAMRARPEGCEELRAVSLDLSLLPDEEQAACEALQALLSRLSPRRLEELTLTTLPAESLQAAPIVPALTAGWAALNALELSFLDVYGAASVDGLLHALARGAMPSLTSLDLSDGACSDEAWRALGEAMGPEGTCLRRIKTLRLYEVISGSRQLAILCGAIWTGHGCPELEVIRITGNFVHAEAADGGLPWGAALARAFRPPHGLPLLKQLNLYAVNLTDLDQLVEALQHRPHASQPMQAIDIGYSKFENAAALARAVEEGGPLANLKQLSLSSCGGGVEEWSTQLLVEALAGGGAGQQLEEIKCSANGLSADAVNRLLQGLSARGAHPRLRSLSLWRTSSAIAEGGLLDACSLGAILAGRAACSATLRKLRLANLRLGNEGVRGVAACLGEPQAIQLESLELCAGEPDACEAVMELLSALGGRAGARLRGLRMYLTRHETGEVGPVVEHVVGLIKAGGLPAMPHRDDIGWEGVRISSSGMSGLGHAEVRQASEERAKAEWLGSW